VPTLTTGTFGAAGSWGWTIYHNPNGEVTYETSAYHAITAPLSPFCSDGTTYTDTSTVGVSYPTGTEASPYALAQFCFPGTSSCGDLAASTASAISLATAWFRTTLPQNATINCDCFTLIGSGSGGIAPFANAILYGEGSQLVLEMEGGQTGNPIPIPSNTWIQIAIQYQQGGTGMIAVYDAQNNQIGDTLTSTMASGAGGEVTVGDGVAFPITPASDVLQWGKVEVCYTNCTAEQFPLLMGGSSGTTATPTNWSATSITVPVPAGAITGNVVVTVGGQASNGVAFTVTIPAPSITNLSPTSGPVGTSVTITGTNLGTSGTVTFNNTTAATTSWTATSITAKVPTGATTGNVVVTTGGLSSNGFTFTVTTVAPLVQHTSIDAGTTTSAGLSFSSNNTAGNWIGVCIRAGAQNETFTVTDTRGNTYRTALQFNETKDGNTLAIFYAENIGGGANTVTVSQSVSAALRFAILEYTGIATSGSLDVTVKGQGNSGTASSGNLTTTANGDLLLGAVMTADPESYTAGAGYEIEESVPGSPNTKLVAEDQIQRNAGSVAASATLGSSDIWAAGLAAFKAATSVVGVAPNITNLSPTSGPVGTSVTITGTNLGTSGTVTFNNTTAAMTSWTATSITAKVPTGATTGNVVVTTGGLSSNGFTFTVTTAAPSITSLSQTSGPVGTTVIINGSNFGATKNGSNVTFNGTTASTTAWGTTSITVTVPTGATNGNVVVTVGGQASNGILFTVTNSGSITVTLSPTRAGLTVTQMLSMTATTNDSAGVIWSATGGTFSAGNSLSGVAVTYTAPSTAGVYTITATSMTDIVVSASITVGVSDLPGVYTYHHDNARDGANTQEFALTPSDVNTNSFGKLFSCTVDGAVYAQPLWVANLAIGGGKHNVVFVATQHDSLYAFDADANPCVQLWHVSLIDSTHGGTTGETSVPSGPSGYLVGSGSGDITPEVGVTGTPVIDPATNILYVVSKSVVSSGPTFYQRLHAIDLATGTEKPGSPALITASFPGTGDGGSTDTFSARQESQRPGLAFANGTVYIAWASHEDHAPYYGWVIGYTYNGSSFTRSSVLNVSPNVGYGGIWMGGAAPAADDNGSLYVITGNAQFDATNASAPNNDYGDSFLQLSASLAVNSYFTPSDQSNDNMNDNDFGAGGAAVVLNLPSGSPKHLVIGGGKDGTLYLLNGDTMGGYGDSFARQHFALGHGIFSTGAFWNNNYYIAGVNGPVVLYTFDTGGLIFNASIASQSSTSFGFPGATPSVSSSGTSNGIVWALDNSSYCTSQSYSCGPAVLHAYDASTLSADLWNSSIMRADAAGNAVKFTVPTVANGKVYVGTRGNNTGGVYGSTSVSGELDVYGLKPN
jgi:hypothetical protein